ncbi:MAG: flagellar hook-basal body complex protein FliE [Armatimonadetes bacterium]|nr:flagellar hook-basal body complex protein FliE [Armatimonadota bacterium]
MASIGGIGGGGGGAGGGDLMGLMNSLKSAGGAGGTGGSGGAMGAATEKFGGAMESALRGDVSGTMNQLNSLTSQDPSKLYEGGALGKAATASAKMAMGSGDAGSVAGLVDSMSKAIQSRIETTEASKKTAEANVQTLITGGDIDLHNVILASERAGLELKLTMTLRNKLLEAYQEVMRIPV